MSKIGPVVIPENYTLIRREELPDIHAEGYLLRHSKTGARVVLIPCEDSNKVFNIAFRTPPADSTGVAHIIEHTVLCGSREFPLKDPFVELMKGSLNTFLNAMTYPDKTMYPVASTNDADFRNLMHVYLDAVFYPNIYRDRRIFLQEGWHYELEEPDGELTYNGVVYNEMKGAFSTPDSVLERETMNMLFPDTAYGVESGGDPEVIPDLTYEAYLDFHRRYYHPSNSYIYLYGDLDMEDALIFMDAKYLSHFEPLEIDSNIRTQKPFTKPVTVVREYPVSEDEPLEENTYFSYNIVTGDPLDITEMIACDVLDYALLSAPGAPVRQALLDAEIGKDVYGEYNDGILQPYFSIIAKNANEDDADRFVDIIRSTLREQAEKGINRKSLEAAINYLEFQYREADYASYPKGLMYGLDLFDSWLYDDEKPFVALKQLKAYEELRSAIEEGYFEKFITEKVLANPHTGLMILRPKRGMQEENEAKTAVQLANYKASLSAAEIKGLIDATEDLLAWQEEPDDPEEIAKLPMLSLDDISREPHRLSNEEEHIAVKNGNGEEVPIHIVWHNADTNGIGYLEMLFDICDLPEEELPYAALLKSVLLNVDTTARSYMDLNNEINASTGGINCGILTTEARRGENGYQAFFSFSMKALYSRLSNGLELLREVMTESLFDDEKRIREIIQSARSALQVRMQNAGHASAALRAASYYSSVDALNEMLGGISYYRFIKDLEDHYDEKKAEIRAKLEQLCGNIFDERRLLLSFTCEPSGREHFLNEVPKVLIKTEGGEPGTPVCVSPIGVRNEGFTTAGKVQFVAMAGRYQDESEKMSGVMSVARQILNCEYLWQNIRVKGGAYGCGASFKNQGDAVFTSYRDPNLDSTRKIYLGIPDYFRTFEADEKEMTKYIIGTISAMDTPMTPSTLGSISMRNWLIGREQKDLEERRAEVLGTTVESIRSLGDVVERVFGEEHLCVIGGSAAIEGSKELFGTIEGLL